MTDQASRSALRATLKWQLDAGADEATGRHPRNRFATAPQALADGAPQAPKPGPAPPQDRASPAPVHRSGTPRDRPTPRPQPLVADAHGLAAACHSLDALLQAIRDYDGCALKSTAANTVIADGNPNSDLMLVGEAPGAEEDRRGLPFVGAAGRLLDLMLGTIERDRTTAYITNMLFWRPPGNRNPTPEEITLCLPFVRRHVALIKPRVLVFVGGIAAKTLLKRKEGITRLRGRWHNFTADEDGPDGAAPIPAIAIYHPAYLLRQPGQKRDAWRDLLAIKSRLDVP